MVQLLGGLITYLLLAIYCREQYHEPVSIESYAIKLPMKPQRNCKPNKLEKTQGSQSKADHA